MISISITNVFDGSSYQLLALEPESISPPGAGGPTGDGGRTVDRKGLDRGRDRDQAREARKEGESEIEMTQDEGKEGGSEAGRSKRKRAGRSNEAED